NNVVTISPTADLAVGMQVSGGGLPSGTTITAVSATTITLSTTIAAGSPSLTFTPSLTVNSGATLSGSGNGAANLASVTGAVIGPVVVNGDIAPGTPGYPTPLSTGNAGVLTTGDLTLNSSGIYKANVNNPTGVTATAGADYDQIQVNNGTSTNNVTLTSAPPLNATGTANNPSPAGQALTLITSPGATPSITGTFNGVPQLGSVSVTPGGISLTAFYDGGPAGG